MALVDPMVGGNPLIAGHSVVTTRLYVNQEEHVGHRFDDSGMYGTSIIMSRCGNYESLHEGGTWKPNFFFNGVTLWFELYVAFI